MIALDKSYMVTFSWEGKTKQIEVKSGNLIPVSEIPEIYAPDGKAVVWYNIKNSGGQHCEKTFYCNTKK